VFWGRDKLALKRLPHKNVPLGAGQFSYCITDEQARLNVNFTTPARFDGLLQALGLEKSDRDVIVDSWQDWRDANEDHRLNGAESEDYYLKLPLPYRSKNANLDSITELLQIKGITPAIYSGTPGKPGLAAYVTVKSPGQVNLNTTSCTVLRSLGFGDAECSAVEQTRRAGAYVSVPGQFGGRGLSLTTRTFRIEADGIIDGQVRAQLTAIVQRQAGTTGDTVSVLEWSGVR